MDICQKCNGTGKMHSFYGARKCDACDSATQTPAEQQATGATRIITELVDIVHFLSRTLMRIRDGKMHPEHASNLAKKALEEATKRLERTLASYKKN